MLTWYSYFLAHWLYLRFCIKFTVLNLRTNVYTAILFWKREKMSDFSLATNRKINRSSTPNFIFPSIK